MELKPNLSIVFSFRNEAEVIPELIGRLRGSLQAAGMNYEIIFVNDESTDGSKSLLIQEAKKDGRIKLINMSRRFGVTQCFMAGIRYASGDAVVIMDSDLQDPPELIPEMIQKWRDGAEVVYTQRTKRAGESFFKTWMTRTAYKIIKLVSEVDLPVDSGEYKLMSRRVVEELVRLNEKEPYIRGLVRFLGFPHATVFYHREKRVLGKSHFPLYSSGPVKTFISGVLSFSLAPLYFSFFMGMILFFLSLADGIILTLAAFGHHSVPGWAIYLAMVLFLGAIQLISVGVLGLYIGKIYRETQNRPDYIIESTLGFESADILNSRR